MPHKITMSPQWLAAIDELYNAVGEEQRLAQALDAFRQVLGARSASFFTIADNRHPASFHIGAVGMSDQMLVEYHAHYNVHDEWVNAAVRRPDFGVGSVYRGTELVATSTLHGSYFGRTFLSRHGVSDVLAAVVEIGGSDGPTSFVSFHRHQASRPFAATQAQLLRALAPHLRQVLRLHRRLAPELAIGATLREVVGRVDVPLVFLGANGTIIDRNPAATAVLQAEPSWMRERSGRLFLALESGWNDVTGLLEGLGQNAATVDLIDDRRRCARLELMPVQGITLNPMAQYPIVAVASLRPGATDRLQALRQAWGLTAAEARVAAQITDGASAADVAAAMGLSISTIRSHIASAMGKLGVDRQAQLVSRVLGL